MIINFEDFEDTKKLSNFIFKVKKKLDPDGNLILELSQRKFFKDPNRISQPDDSLWNIPIRIKTKSSEFVHLVVDKNSEINLGIMSQSELVTLNSGSNGFFRVKYSEKMFHELLDSINDPTSCLTSFDKISIINDIFALVF